MFVLYLFYCVHWGFLPTTDSGQSTRQLSSGSDQFWDAKFKDIQETFSFFYLIKDLMRFK